MILLLSNINDLVIRSVCREKYLERPFCAFECYGHLVVTALDSLVEALDQHLVTVTLISFPEERSVCRR